MDYNDIISKNMNRYNELRDNLSNIREAADNSTAQDIIDKYNEGVQHLTDLGQGIGTLGIGIHSARKAYKKFKNRGKVKENKENQSKTEEEQDTEPPVDHSTQSQDRAPREDPQAEDIPEPSETTEPLFKDAARTERMRELDDSGENPTIDDVQRFDSVDDVFEDKPDSMFKRLESNLTERSKNPNLSSEQTDELNDLLQKQATERNQLSGSEEWKNMSDEEAKTRFADLKTQQAGEYESKLTNFENPQNPEDTARNPQPEEPENPLGGEDAPVEGPLPKEATPGSDEAEKVLGDVAPEGEEAGLGVAEGVLDALGPIGEVIGGGLAIYSLIESLTGNKAPSAEELKQKAFQQAAPAATSVGVDVAKYQPQQVVGSLL